MARLFQRLAAELLQEKAADLICETHFECVVKKSLSRSLFEKTRPILGRPKIAARLVAILASYPGCENRHPHAFLKATPPSDFFTTSPQSKKFAGF